MFSTTSAVGSARGVVGIFNTDTPAVRRVGIIRPIRNIVRAAEQDSIICYYTYALTNLLQGIITFEPEFVAFRIY